MNDYELINIVSSNRNNNKYAAILKNRINNNLKMVHFGNRHKPHYCDKTDLHLYSYLDHNDDELRYIFLHKNIRNLKDNYFSPTYFNLYYLW